MKARRKKTPPRPPRDPELVKMLDELEAEPKVRIDRRAVDTTLLVQLDELEHIAEVCEADVDGAIVKVCPRITASDRDRFDAASTARRIRELGARSVVISPIVVPDAAEKPRALAPKLKPRELVDAWLDEQHLDDDDLEAVRACVVGFMDKEGL